MAGPAPEGAPPEWRGLNGGACPLTHISLFISYQSPHIISVSSYHISLFISYQSLHIISVSSYHISLLISYQSLLLVGPALGAETEPSPAILNPLPTPLTRPPTTPTPTPARPPAHPHTHTLSLSHTHTESRFACGRPSKSPNSRAGVRHAVGAGANARSNSLFSQQVGH